MNKSLNKFSSNALTESYIFTMRKDFDKIKAGTECIAYLQLNGGCWVIEIKYYISEKSVCPSTITRYGNVKSLKSMVESMGAITKVINKKGV